MENGAMEPTKLPELKLDARQAQGFISFFKTLPRDPRAVRFFDRRDYYTVHGDNATFVSSTYYHTSSALRQLGSGSDGISSVTVSKNIFETIARDLLLERNDHTLEVYEGSGSNWKLTKSGTPGKLGSFEEILFANNDMQDSPVIVAVCTIVRENQSTVGLSYIDMSKWKIGITEFLDDSQFANTETVLVALGCKECLLPIENSKSASTKLLHDALNRCSVLLTERKKTEFKSRDLVPDLGRIVRGSVEPVKDLLSEFNSALGALGALLSYVDILGDDRNYGNYTIEKYTLGNYMRLDSAAVKALNVFESKTDANKSFSLFGLMNRTCTAGMGKRLLNRWLKQPLLDVTSINQRLDVVQAFVEHAPLCQGLRQQLKRISDIERLTSSLRKKSANLQPVIKLYQSSIRIPHIKDVLLQYEGQFSNVIKENYIDPLEYWMDEDHLIKFISLVEVSVDLDQLENGELMISSGYDPNLAELKEELETVEKQIHSLHRQTAEDLDLTAEKTLKLEKGTQYGHVFRITKKEEQKVRRKLNSNYTILETRKDGVKFTNSRLKKMGDQYQKVLDAYSKCQREIVLRVVDTSATFSEVFEACAGILSELDVLLSFADLAGSCPTPYTRPDITPSEEGDIVLEGSRHPCVEAQDGISFIPNDCRLVRGKSWFQIITGPNMGGKSTFIRQVGVNVLMAQVGCFIPCDKATVSIRDCIFARVGAGDCQLRGVSTFMQEMLETASILNAATQNSLIIIDELGRGTSTYDGFGLAWAISAHIVDQIKAPTLFATHFHELTTLGQGDMDFNSESRSFQEVENYHVGAHIDPSTRKLTMLYKVEPGACDQSFGIHVAEFANFPPSVVSLARAKAEELEDFSSTNVELDTEQAVGNKRKWCWNDEDVATGAERAHKFLREFSNLPLDRLDPAQISEEISRLKSNLESDAGGNPWLQQFFVSS
ncbi:MUTS homolog 2 [Wolffia australiana]